MPGRNINMNADIVNMKDIIDIKEIGEPDRTLTFCNLKGIIDFRMYPKLTGIVMERAKSSKHLIITTDGIDIFTRALIAFLVLLDQEIDKMNTTIDFLVDKDRFDNFRILLAEERFKRIEVLLPKSTTTSDVPTMIRTNASSFREEMENALSQLQGAEADALVDIVQEVGGGIKINIVKKKEPLVHPLAQTIYRIRANDENKVERIREILMGNPDLKMYKFERIKDGYSGKMWENSDNEQK